MLRRRLSCRHSRRSAVLVLPGLARAGAADGPGRRLRQGSLHEVRISHPDARRGPALHVGLRPQGSDRSATRSCCRGRPTACSPTASTPTRRTSALRLFSARTATSWSTRTSAAAGCRRASSSTCGRTGRRRAARKTSMRARDTFDTIDWLIKQRAQPQRPGRHVGHLLSRASTRPPGMIDAHPALKAASPQAPVTDWFTGDDWHHNGAFLLPHAFNFLAVVRPSAPRADQEGARAVRLRHARRLRLLPAAGPALQRQRALFQGRRAVLERDHAARDVRRVLESPQPPPAPEEHQAGRHDRRRLVRRREPLRCARDLQERRSQQPGRDQCPGDGPLAARRLEPAATATSLGPVPFSSKTSEFYREHIEFPFFQYYLKGKGSPSFPGGLGLRDRHQPVADVRRLAAAQRRSADRSSCKPAGRPGVRRRRPTRTTPPSTST